jgi:putative NIF3 family GTP cyclohydrolase 1 type 2
MCIIEGMSNLADVIASLEHLAPLRLAADWDNVGLLVATKKPAIHRVMTCLTLTIDVAREAVSQKSRSGRGPSPTSFSSDQSHH